jgi:hypothetical protein
MVCGSFIAVAGIFAYTNIRKIPFTSGDKYTYCIEKLLVETRHSGKPIDAKEAIELCKNVSEPR